MTIKLIEWLDNVRTSVFTFAVVIIQESTAGRWLPAFVGTRYPRILRCRVNHIHLKIHPLDANARVADAKSYVVHTGQAFSEVIARTPATRDRYAQHHIERTTLAQNPLCGNQSGSALMTHVRRIKRGFAEAYVPSITLAVRTASTRRSFSSLARRRLYAHRIQRGFAFGSGNRR